MCIVFMRRGIVTVVMAAMIMTLQITAGPLPYVGDPSKDSLMTNIPMYDVAGNELGREWFQPKWKIPIERSSASDGNAFDPVTRHSTDFNNPDYKPSEIIPEFQEESFTWPTPIVDADGKAPQRLRKQPRPPALPPGGHSGVKFPGQSNRTPFPNMNVVAEYPSYPGGRADHMQLSRRAP